MSRELVRERSGEVAGPMRRRRPFWSSVVTAALVCLTLTAVLAGWAPSPLPRAAVSEAFLVAAAALVLVRCLLAVRVTRGRMRRIWICWSVAGACWTAGRLSLLLTREDLLGRRDPSIGDAFLLLAGVPAAVALLLVPATARSARERAINLLGCVLVALSLVFVGHSVRLALGIVNRIDSLADTVATGYPVVDVLLLALAIITLIRMGGRARLRLALVVAAIALLTASDSYYAVGSALGWYQPGNPPDVGWLVAYLLVVLATLAPGSSEPTRPAAQDRPWVAALIYLPVLAASVAAAALPSRTPQPLLVVDGLLILVVFGARQVLLAVEHAHISRHRAEQVKALQRSGAQLRRQVAETRRITASVPDGIVVLDDAFAVVDVNEPAARLLDAEPETLRGEMLLSWFDPDDPHVSLVQEAVREGHTLSAVDAALRRGTVRVPVAVTVGPIVENDQRLGTIVVVRDITARKAVEQMKNEFLSVVSHELRTPLTSIRGSLALLEGGMGGALQPRGARMVEMALEGSERLSRLIDDLIDVERIESGRLTMTFEPCDAGELVDRAIREMRGMAQAHQVRLTRLDVRGDVLADPDRIVQTLTNLVSNAVKFSEPGAEVRISAEPARVGSTAMVEFCVADDGRGVPADKLDAIFERFEQVDSSDARLKGGAGLGLAICRNIVEGHGGRIWVTSEPGRGSQFRFRLPRPAPTPAVRPAGPPELSRSAETNPVG